MRIRQVLVWEADDFPDWFKQSFEVSGLSVQEFCKAAEISRQTYYDLINAKAETLSRETLGRIEAVLGKKYLD